MSLWQSIKNLFTKPLPVDWLTAGSDTEKNAPYFEVLESNYGVANPANPRDIYPKIETWNHGWWSQAQRKDAHPGRLGAQIAPSAIVVHTTDMYPGAFDALVKAWQSKPGAGNAAHFLIGRTPQDGVVQFAPITRNANHAGGTPYGKFRVGTTDYHPNRVCVGIELDAAGRLRRDAVSGRWVHPDSGKPIDPADVFVDTRGGGWHVATPYQREMLSVLVGDLQSCLKPFASGVGIRPTGEYKAEGVPWAESGRLMYPKNCVGHVTLDPVRKSDPGPQVTAWMEKGL